MKNSIQFIAIALFLFSNVASASGLIKKENLNNSTTLQAKTVSFADENLFKAEIDGLEHYVQTIADVINSDIKITENEKAIKTNSFISYANDDLILSELNVLKKQKSIEFQIRNDLEITESPVVEQSSFVSYANSNLIQLEVDTLKLSKPSIAEIIVSNSTIIDAETYDSKIEIIRSKDNSAVIKKTIQY